MLKDHQSFYFEIALFFHILKQSHPDLIQFILQILVLAFPFLVCLAKSFFPLFRTR